LRDYDPQLDTIERWGEEAMNEIVATGQVDDWTDEGTQDESRKSLLRTVGQQGEHIETLIIGNEDLKSENNQLQLRLRKAGWLNILFGSAVILMLLVTLI
jgi:hypothetical protein